MLGYALVKDSAGVLGLASINGSNQIVRLSGGLVTLATNTNDTVGGPFQDYTTTGITNTFNWVGLPIDGSIRSP